MTASKVVVKVLESKRSTDIFTNHTDHTVYLRFEQQCIRVIDPLKDAPGGNNV